MARGLEIHQERINAVALLGKNLARRAGRKCEWCEESGSLRPYDTAPDDEPTLEALMLLCSRCTELADGIPQDARTLRFLEGAVWNEEPTVAEWARKALRTVDTEWARDTLAMFGG